MTDRRYAATKELVESWNRSRTHGTGDAVGMYTDTSAGSLSSAETSCRTDLRLLLPPAPSDLLALWLERSGLTLMSCSRAPINSWLEVRMRPCVCVCVSGLFCRSLAAVCFCKLWILIYTKDRCSWPIFFKGVFEHKVSVWGLHVVACV